jgi:3',5'-cyclic AMP phosphodiesterase CpdA
MPRAHIVSDIHHDHDHPEDRFKASTADFDIVMCAGDVQQPLHRSLPWLRSTYPGHPIIYVPGNHDFYSAFNKKQDHDLKTTYEFERDQGHRIAREFEITLLDNESCIIEDGTPAGIKIFGSTLWTDFMLRPPYQQFGDAVRLAERRHNDFKCIKIGRGRSKDQFQPRHAIAAHREAVKWLTAALAEEHDGRRIVISHHCPHPKSVGFVDEFTAIYGSDLSAILESPNAPELWIHGHVHKNCDYEIGNTRVLCNPRGYPLSNLKNAPRENPDFIEDLVVGIGREYVPTMGM